MTASLTVNARGMAADNATATKPSGRYELRIPCALNPGSTSASGLRAK
jgi:hypothetical protein